MANALITPTIIAKLILASYKNNLALSRNAPRETSKEFAKVGNSVNVRKQVWFDVKSGATRQHQDVEEANTSITVDERWHSSFGFTTEDLTLTVEQFNERYAKNIGTRLANKTDEKMAELYKYLYMNVGDGSTPATFKEFGAPIKRLKQNGVPLMNTSIVLDPEAELEAADMLKGTQVGSLATQAVRGMTIGQLAGASIMADQNIIAHSESDDWGASVKVDGANQDVTYANASHNFGPTHQTLDIDGLTNATGTLKAGDKFTITGVNAVNPVNKNDLGFLQEFTVVEDIDYTSSSASPKIAPAIITSGPYQTVTAAPADNADISMKGDYTANIAGERGWAQLATVPLELPDSATFKARESHDGLSVRVIKDYDIDNDEEVIRYDILFGVKATNPGFACVLRG